MFASRLLFKKQLASVGSSGLKFLFCNKKSTQHSSISKATSKILAKALWAAVYHDEILQAQYGTDQNTNLLRQLRNLSAENGLKKFLGNDKKKKLLNQQDIDLMNQMIQEKKYMQGFFSNGIEGPILKSQVFNQERFKQAVPKSKRLCFYPSEVTLKMFAILQSMQKNLIVTGQRGIGKSFAIMLYSYLNQHIMEAVVENNRNNASQQQAMAPIFKPHKLKIFYWTVGQQQYQHTNQNAIEVISTTKQILMQQCIQIKSEVQPFSEQFDLQVGKLNLTSPNVLSNATLILQTFFKKVKAIYQKYGLSILLAVDQINAIVAEYRKAQARLNQPKKNMQNYGNDKTEQKIVNKDVQDNLQQNDYKRAVLHDMIRRRLNSVADYSIYNSSVNIEESLISHYKKKNKLQMGSKHNPYKRTQINLPEIKGRKQRNQEMIDSFLQELQRIIQSKTSVKDCARIIKQVRKIIYEKQYGNILGGLFTRQVLRNIQIQKVVDKIPEKIEKSMKENCESMLINYIQKTYSQSEARFGIDVLPSSTVDEERIHKMYRFSAQMILLGRILQQCGINKNLIKQQSPQQQINIGLNLFLQNAQSQKDFDELYDKELFYVEKRSEYDQTVSLNLSQPEQTSKPNLNRYYLRSYLPMQRLKQLLNNCMNAKRLGSVIYKTFIGYELGLAAYFLQDGSAGYPFEHLLMKSVKDSDKMVLQLKDNPIQFYFRSPFTFYSADQKSLKSILEGTKQLIENNGSALYCIPAQKAKIQGLKQLVKQGKYIFKLSPYQSRASDFLILTQSTGFIDFNFFELTTKTSPITKINNFLRFLWSLEQFKSQKKGLIQFYKINLFIVGPRRIYKKVHIQDYLQAAIKSDQSKAKKKQKRNFPQSTPDSIQNFRRNIKAYFNVCYIIDALEHMSMTRANAKCEALLKLETYIEMFREHNMSQNQNTNQSSSKKEQNQQNQQNEQIQKQN